MKNNYEFWDKYLKRLKRELARIFKENKEIYIDFHMHSNYSADGKQSVSQILESTKSKGFSVIAITDHDSINVYDEIYHLVKDGFTDPLIIPGVEFTMDNREYGNQCHLLQLFINPKDPDLIRNVKIQSDSMFNRSKIQFTRIKENKALQELFKKHNFKVRYDEYKKYLSRNDLIPEYDTLCFYLIDKFKEHKITTFDVLDLLEKYNENDIYEDRKLFKSKRYSKLREKYEVNENNLYNSRFLLSMLAVREVDDDWWDKPSSGSLSVNSYGQLKVEDLNEKFPIYFAHPTESSLDVVDKLIKNKKNIIGMELNIRNHYEDINNFYKVLNDNKMIKIIGSDSHDNSLQFYNDMNFYKISTDELTDILR